MGSMAEPESQGLDELLNLRSVGVVGAGVSGILAAKYLLAAGLEVTVFERARAVGGVWLYDHRVSKEPDYPTGRPGEEAGGLWDGDCDEDGWCDGIEEADVLEEGNGNVDDVELRHAPPGPCYEGLTNNLCTVLMELKDHPWPWPSGTNEWVGHPVILKYVQDASRKFGVEERIVFDTAVDRVEKRGETWHVRTTTLTAAEGGNEGAKKVWKKRRRNWEFDAIVVASGQYHACRIPTIPGLKGWRAAWPDRVQHSKTYRSPKGFKDQNVLLIGGGTSSTEIARELGPYANKIYQSARGSVFDLPLDFLPANCERVGEIASFESPFTSTSTSTSSPLPSSSHQPIPYRITLQELANNNNNTPLPLPTPIHRVILCTGYHNTYPFLHPRSLYYTHPAVASTTAPATATPATTLTTTGTQTHNLHRDMFYIADATLAFLGVSLYITTFPFYEFQALAIAAVFAGRARLEDRAARRAAYEVLLERRGGEGKMMHAHHDEEVEYVEGLVKWLNAEAGVLGGGGGGNGGEGWKGEKRKGKGKGPWGRVEGYSEAWLEERKVNKLEKVRERFRREKEEEERGKRMEEEEKGGSVGNGDVTVTTGAG